MSKKNRANNFKIFRITKDLTQEELAQRVGVSSRTIGLYEAGKRFPSVDIARQISKEFGKGIEEIFFAD